MRTGKLGINGNFDIFANKTEFDVIIDKDSNDTYSIITKNRLGPTGMIVSREELEYRNEIIKMHQEMVESLKKTIENLEAINLLNENKMLPLYEKKIEILTEIIKNQDTQIEALGGLVNIKNYELEKYKIFKETIEKTIKENKNDIELS